MRILMTADAVGGVWNYALGLSSELSRYDVLIDLATMGPPPSCAQKQSLAEIPNITLYESCYRLEWMEDPWNDVGHAGNWLLELEKCLGPDIIHLNGYSHAALPWAAPTCVVAHSCVLSWWQAVHGTSAPSPWNRYRRAVSTGIAAADHVVAPTRSMLNALCRNYLVPAARSVIYNGAYSRLFSPGTKLPIIFSAGRLWDAAKNIATVIECAAEVPWKVIVAGDGASLFRRTRNLELLGQVPPELVAKHMSAASIYCLPARYEPFGLSILEAALSGCALVLGDIPSLRELWYEVALFVDPNDRSQLVTALWRLIEDENLRVERGIAARLRARNFSQTRTARAYLRRYQKLNKSLRFKHEKWLS